MTVDGHYRTTDMALAIALQLNGFTPVLEKTDGDRRVHFCFNPNDAGGAAGLDSLVAEYDTGELLVEPKQFMVMQKKTRERLYDLLGVRDGRRIRV